MNHPRSLNGYRKWFWAAAAYNAVWGAFASLFPATMFHWVGMKPPEYLWMFQCIGMLVGVYAIAYALIAIDPVRYGALVWVGLAGKILGPLGFLFNAFQGVIPWSFGWINVANDVIWLPVFILFGHRHWKGGYLFSQESQP